MKKPIYFIIAAALAAVGFADEIASPEHPKTGFSSGGYVFWENYRLWAASDANGAIHEGDWFNSILGGFVLENQMSERLHTRVALEARFIRPFPELDGYPESRQLVYSAYVHEAKAVYVFGDVAHPFAETEVGYFLYDYNKEQHNLGEYLFRSNIYPIILNTDFELPMDRLLGIRIGNNPFKGFHHDLLLTSEYKYYPKSDFSFSYLADYNLGNVFKIGAGVSFHHLIQVRPRLDAPTKEENTYLKIPAQTFQDTSGNPITIAAPVEGFQSIVISNNANLSYLDSLGVRHMYPGIQMDRTNYSFAGIKLMAQASFDPKPLLGGVAKIFGEEDLKVYTEAAVLGTKDYVFLYPDIKERIPVMFGFNFPCFNLLDVFGIEGEYFASKFPDNWEKSLNFGLPQPGDKQSTGFTDWGTRVYSKDDWKWSFYMRKHLSKGLFVTAQAASDHLRLPDKDGNQYESVMRHTGTPFNGQWWGILRVTASY
jgi:hypothetical protein